MAYKQGSHKVHKVMIQPIVRINISSRTKLFSNEGCLIYFKSITQPVLFQNVIFRHLQKRTRVSVWLYEATGLKIEGIVVGFDEFMNICLDEAQEVVIKKGQVEKRKEIGNQILTAI